MEYAIVDIETAGGNPKGGGITEIAVYPFLQLCFIFMSLC